MAPFCLFLFFCGGRFRGTAEPAESGEAKRDPFLRSLSGSQIAATGSPCEARVRSEAREALREEHEGPSWRLVARVLVSPVFACLMFGFAASQFSLGGLMYWASSYLENVLHVRKSVGSLALSAMTLLTGILGSTGGGLLLDRLTARAERRGDSRPGLRCATGCWLAFCFGMAIAPCAAASLAFESPALFLLTLCGAELAIFLAAAPIIVSTMECVAPSLRGLSMALCLLGSHLFGDLFSPVIVGEVEDVTGSLRDGMWLLALWTLWCPVFWGAAALIAARSAGDGHSGLEKAIVEPK